MTANLVDLNLRALNVGIPAQLLQYRPDIRQAERELAAAGLDVLVFRARFFPRLDLTGSIGFEAFSPRYLFDPEALIGNVAGGLVQPLVNWNAIQADFISANARQLQAIYNYQRVILNAFTEVVNSLAMAQNYHQSVEIKKQQMAALEISVDVATSLFQSDRAEYGEVLFSQRDLLDVRTVLIRTKQQELSAIVRAYQAIGGGLLLSTSPQFPIEMDVPLLPPAEGPALPTPAVPIPASPGPADEAPSQDGASQGETVGRTTVVFETDSEVLPQGGGDLDMDASPISMPSGEGLAGETVQDQILPTAPADQKGVLAPAEHEERPPELTIKAHPFASGLRNSTFEKKARHIREAVRAAPTAD